MRDPEMSTDDAPSEGGAPPPTGGDRATVARVYDAFLGGKDNYEVDREVLRRAQQVAPDAAQLGSDNQEFMIRATQFIAGQTGIMQYLDCGSRMPTAEHTHRVVQRAQPDAQIVYVDKDPVALAHGRALLAENDQTHLADADIFTPEKVLNNEIVRRYLDFSQPIALFQCGTLHHYNGERAPSDIMAAYIDALAPGSYVVFSHFYDPETTEHSEL